MIQQPTDPQHQTLGWVVWKAESPNILGHPLCRRCPRPLSTRIVEGLHPHRISVAAIVHQAGSGHDRCINPLFHLDAPILLLVRQFQPRVSHRSLHWQWLSAPLHVL